MCAACKCPDTGTVILGARHFDTTMHTTIRALGVKATKYEQGFIDQWGDFMDRKEALEVAKDADQILEKTFPEDILFSEDIY